MATAELNRATTNARRELRYALQSTANKLDWLRDTNPGSLEQSLACDEIVHRCEEALSVARDLAALAHANAGNRHGEAARPEMDVALRKYA